MDTRETPRSAVFALGPDHINIEGEDHQGFRAIAERSMMADCGKDTVVAMFPELAWEWKKELNARRGWSGFREADFRRLADSYGISWVVVQKPSAAHLECPYRNVALLVCQVEAPNVRGLGEFLPASSKR